MKLYINSKLTNLQYNSFFTPPFIGYEKCAYAKIFEENETDIEIEYEKEIKSACIRPLKADIPLEIRGNKVKFTLKERCNISVEVNGDIKNAVILFFDRQKTPDFTDFENIIKFEGEEHIDILDVTQDNTIIYFAQNSVVHGKLRIKGVNNLKICGHGTITMREYARDCIDINTRCVDILDCKNVVVEDFLITDSTQWCFRCDNCEDVIIDNVKVLGCRGNNDGFDICGSRRVHMKNCFVRAFDDSVSVKGLDSGNIEDILVEKCVFWNDMARSMNVGSEISCDHARNIIFRDIDVIHNLTSYPICQIHNGDRGKVSNVVFENIRIEHAPYSYLFDLRIKSCHWNVDKNNGYIDNVLFKDIQILGDEGSSFTNLIARAEGLSEEASISNVTIENLTAYGKSISSPEECGLKIYDHCSNIRFISKKNDFGLIEPKIEIEKNFDSHDGILKVYFKNTNPYSVSGKFSLQIFPTNSAKYQSQPVEYSLAPGECFEKLYDVSVQPGKYIAQTQSDNIGMKIGWIYFEVTGVLNEEPQLFRFNDYYGNSFEDIHISVRNNFLVLESKHFLHNGASIFVAKPAEICDEEVLFTCEECDWGEAYAIKHYKGKPDIAYELGNPLEITLVYLNMPKTNITEYKLIDYSLSEKVHIPFSKLGLTGKEDEILLEIALEDTLKKRYRKTLFRSVDPLGTAHMFGKFRIK